VSSDARVVAIAVGVAALLTLFGVWFAAWISQFHLGRPPVRRRLPEPVLGPPVTRGVDRRQLLGFAQELTALADTAAAQAARARAELEAARATLAASEAALARAESGYDTARLAYAAALGAARAGRPQVPDEQAQAREREVSRAALDAYRRGELSVEALQSVFGRTDPDPLQAEREREVDRLAIAETQARRDFEHAVVVTRMAREDLHVAEVADAATQQEAAAAAADAQEAQFAVAQAAPRRRGSDRRRGSGTAHRPRRDAHR
jgi:hypothetical protein